MLLITKTELLSVLIETISFFLPPTEHVKLVKEEVAFLSEQCKAAEKEKKDAETRLEVLTKFFEEKEAQRQKYDVHFKTRYKINKKLCVHIIYEYFNTNFQRRGNVAGEAGRSFDDGGEDTHDAK